MGMKDTKRHEPTRFMEPDSHYSEEAADYAVNFIECLCHTKGTWAGKPFKLLKWQETIVRDLFGILKPNGYRQFNTAYIEIPKTEKRQERTGCGHCIAVDLCGRRTARRGVRLCV